VHSDDTPANTRRRRKNGRPLKRGESLALWHVAETFEQEAPEKKMLVEPGERINVDFANLDL